MLYFLLAVHLYFTVKLKFVQKYTWKGIKHSFCSDTEKNGIGAYRAFAAALGTTIGPGNIVGVAVAISLGGAGSVFWMWLSGILAMATKYAESYLCVKFKTEVGGTMVLLEKLGHPGLAMTWSVLCGAGGIFMGAAIPSNSLAQSLEIESFYVGLALSVCTLLAVCFGFSAIANISGLLVPVMSLTFTVFCLAVTAKNISVVPSALTDMLKSAFLPTSFVGGGIGVALKEGISRGLYSNESGLGTGGLLAAEAGDGNVKLCACSAMTTPFWDTVVMCAVTGIMFLSTGAKKGDRVNVILDNAFGSLPFGKAFLGISMSVFVFATVIGWYYIAKRAVGYFFKNTAFYDAFYIAAVFFGAVFGQSLLWKVSDAINICLLFPSIYAILRLRNEIKTLHSQ